MSDKKITAISMAIIATAGFLAPYGGTGIAAVIICICMAESL